MHNLKTMLASAVGVTLLVSAMPVLAVPSTGSAADKKDPNRIICEKVTETGSRLNTKKTCMTAQQWEEQHRRDREAVEDAQRRQTEPSGR